MPANVSDLIGQIIDPKPGIPSPPSPPTSTARAESLRVLIGRIVAPQLPNPKA